MLSSSGLKAWLLQDREEKEGPYEEENKVHEVHPWWKVVCLTGVDYFSTLGYQPGIAALAAGALSPFATLILVLVTLFGALPIYNQVAKESPHGEGSISMLEKLLKGWKGKIFVLILLGFVMTDFVITITLSAADATAHIIENPLMPEVGVLGKIGITLILIGLLCAVFLKGFQEAIKIAVALVVSYLTLNLIVLVVAAIYAYMHPELTRAWELRLVMTYQDWIMMVLLSLLIFPKLALGLSGFETGVAVMPLVRGNDDDTEKTPKGRIRNTQKLLLVAAVLMSFYLILSSYVTTILIAEEEFIPGGEANGRAIAYLAHWLLGGVFGTLYDIVTIGILWFAGASAMAGLLNLIPRYLPRYGMAPEWASAMRPLVLVFTSIAVVVTIVFKADVDSQGGAYATGVLVLMSSASVAVSISAWNRRSWTVWPFVVITLVFIYTTVINVYERPDGIKIASIFILATVIVSFVSRVYRSTELRVNKVEFDEAALSLIENASTNGKMRIVSHRPSQDNLVDSYLQKVEETHRLHYIPLDASLIFLEVELSDPSEFAASLAVKGVNIEGYQILRVRSAAIPNAIAAILLELREISGRTIHANFGWTPGNPVVQSLRYLFLGEGDTAPMVKQVLDRAEPDPNRRPRVHVG